MAGFGRSKRLRRGADFTRALKQGPRIDGQGLRLVGRKSGLAEDRLGLAVGRGVGKAVVRNRVKRLLREAFRRRDGFLGGVDVVVVAKPGLRGSSQQEVDRELERAIERLRRRIGSEGVGSASGRRGH